MGKIKKYRIFYLIAVVGSTAFFAHESLLSSSEEYDKANEVFLKDKAIRTDALNKLKEASKHLPEYQIYAEAKVNANKSFEKAIEEYDKMAFLEFKTFQQFMGEFGWAIGLFIYAFFNLVKAFLRRSEELHGEVALHSVYILISFFYIRWCFKKQDFLRVEYILVNIICVFVLVYAVHRFIKWREKYLKALIDKEISGFKQNIRFLINFILDIRNTHYKSIAVKAVAAEKDSPSIDGVPAEKQIETFENEMWNTIEQVDDD